VRLPRVVFLGLVAGLEPVRETLVPEFELPARPDLGQLRRLAKELLAAAVGGDPDAVRRVLAVDGRLILSSAQLAVAREHGFASWRRLVAEVNRRSRSQPPSLGAGPSAAVGTSRLLVRYPSADEDHYRVQIQQVPAGPIPGLVLASPVLRAHTVEEVHALARQAEVPADRVHWLAPGLREPDGPWQLPPDPAEAVRQFEDDPVQGAQGEADLPTEEQRALHQRRIEEAVALGGRIARGEPVDHPGVIAVVRQDLACLALIWTELPGWPRNGEPALLVLWSRHNGRWEAPSTMSGADLRADDEVFHTGSTTWPDGPTWIYVVGHTMDPASPSTVRLGSREVTLAMGRDGYFLGLIQALPGKSVDDLEVIDPWPGGWRQTQLRATAPLDARLAGAPLPLRCSFCGRTDGPDRRLVAGPGTWICDGCAVMADAAERSGMPVEGDRVTMTIAAEPGPCPFCGQRTGTTDPRHQQPPRRLVTSPTGAAICTACIGLSLEILREQTPDS
jgi:hypothetical protein